MIEIDHIKLGRFLDERIILYPRAFTWQQLKSFRGFGSGLSRHLDGLTGSA